MISFASDYITGAHPEVLEQLIKTNTEVLSGYGTDGYTVRAKEKIGEACGVDPSGIFFISGGTQTNAVVLGAILGPTEGAIAADTGHIAVHEAGAIEYTAHKVLTVPGECGKLLPDRLRAYLAGFFADENRTHMVAPGAVYISHPTEYGTLYTKAELTELAEICRAYRIPLFMDGARLGYALATPSSDLTLRDIAELCDVFYIGGTKMGALCGEAVVFTKQNAPRNFVTFIMQRGALLAKGRLLGVQFDALFSNRLYERIGEHAIKMADRLEEMLTRKGYEFYIPSPTNQKFVILTPEQYKRLSTAVTVSFWENLTDGRVVVRLATCWSTSEDDLAALEKIL
jgi:threonine aldolase